VPLARPNQSGLVPEGFADMPDNPLLMLTYRELAVRLRISPGAVRSRVRRAVKAGRWRVVPGNRPNGTAYIELPQADLADLERDASGPAEPAPQPERQPQMTQEQPALYVMAFETLNEAYGHIASLNAQLVGEVRRGGELAALVARGEAERDGLRAEVARLEDWVRQQDTRLATEAMARLREVAELARAQALCSDRERYIAKLENGARNLHARLRRAERPLWKKLLRRGARADG